jgi:hypothetical protein
LTTRWRLLTYKQVFLFQVLAAQRPYSEIPVSPAERRQLERYRIRVPLRFRTLGLASDRTEHFAETANISRGGFFFVTSAPLQVGMPIEATLQLPAEITGGKSDVTRCRARLVHARPDAYSDGRMGFGAEIESYIDPVQLASAPVAKSRTEKPQS